MGAAMARMAALQPTGNTLATTNIQTKVGGCGERV